MELTNPPLQPSSSATNLVPRKNTLAAVHEDDGHVQNVLSLSELKNPDFWRAGIAEMMGTGFFLFFSVSGVIAAVDIFSDAGALHSFILLYHILLILICIYAFSHLSGAHLNPAVTLATLVTGRVTVLRFVYYFFAQLAGSLIGSALASVAIPLSERAAGGFGLARPAPNCTAGQVVLMEGMATFGLVFGAFATAFDSRGWGRLGPFAIATIVGLNSHAASIVSGGAMNPLRAFSPAVVHHDLSYTWQYWIGDMVGGVAGGAAYEYLFMRRQTARTFTPSTSGEHEKRE